MQAGTLRSTYLANGTETVINEDSVDRDFRVESNGQTSAFFINAGADTASFAVPVAVTGAITATGDVTAFSSSDKTLKENISNIEKAVDKVSKINGVYYNWTLDAQEKYAHFGKEKEVGVIAQNVEEVLPEIVQTREDGTKAVKYERLCALLIEAIKELKEDIEKLKKDS